jgi:PAS domain S-box-containing protein
MTASAGDALLQLISGTSPDVILVLDASGLMTFVSPAAERLLGWVPGALPGRPLTALAHPEDRVRLEEVLGAVRLGRPGALQFRVRCADGRHRWVDCAARLAAGEGAAGRSVCILRDEEERHAARSYADQALAEKERYLQAVFDNALDAMVIVDGDGVVVDANPAAERLTGGGPPGPSLLGRALRGMVMPERAAELTGAWSRFLLERQLSGRTEIVATAGPRTVEYALVADVLPGLHLGIIRDVTELLGMQAALALADRLASMGTVAAGVAHELKNPLAYVGANMEFVQEGLAGLAARRPEEARALAPLGEAVREALLGQQRMQVIVRDLKTFSRDDDSPEAVADVHRVLESCVNMSWAEVKRRATLRKELRAVPPVRISDARLGQVFLNLLINAAHSIPEGDPRHHEVGLATRPLEGGWVEVEVWDTGSGIPPEVRSRIFEPFFTTKRPGEGTGLGLSICKSIVETAGGSIAVESEVGRGSRFRVVLPAAEGMSTAVDLRRRRRVLVLDDEPLVASAMERALLAEWDVQSLTRASSLAERLARGERYDVVLCDLSLPEEDGVAVHRLLRRLDPALARRTGFLTGGPVPAAARAYCEAEGIARLEKPFEVLKLRELVARLGARGPAGDSDPPVGPGPV